MLQPVVQSRVQNHSVDSTALCATNSPCQHHTITALYVQKRFSHGALNARCDTMHSQQAGGLENRQMQDHSDMDSIAWGQQTSPHCVSALGPCGKNHGGGPPAACVTAQHLVLSQLYQILQSLLVHLHTHCSDTAAGPCLQHLGHPPGVEMLDASPQASS